MSCEPCLGRAKRKVPSIREIRDYANKEKILALDDNMFLMEYAGIIREFTITGKTEDYAYTCLSEDGENLWMRTSDVVPLAYVERVRVH